MSVENLPNFVELSQENTHLRCWTSYPVDHDANPNAKPNYLRVSYAVSVLAFDGNKYVLVDWNGKLYSMKAGYLCSDVNCKNRIDSNLLNKIPGRKDFWQISKDCQYKVISA